MSTQKAEALFDFEPTAKVELKIRKGDVVTVKRMGVGEGWWEGEMNGKRGLFPSSFVKLLPVVQEAVDTSPTHPPLTPRSTKKAFMETMLAPEPSTLDEIYDEERAREVFVPGHNKVAIEVGPRWKDRPPTLTVIVKEPQTEPRFSGMKHVTLYDVDTKELGSCVARKYKQFLWLYDRLAENFPCISLPPLPVKRGSGQDGKYVRRKGLERFLKKVARHPVLGCTKFLKVFLTEEDGKSDKEWKIGKHLSRHNVKLPKTSRKLFHAPVYCTVKYPPYNVPIGQLASIEKFSRFSRLLESNVNTLHMACRGLTMAQRDMTTNINLLAKDLKCFARGMESTGGAHRRKLQAKVSVSGPSSNPVPATSIPPSLYTVGTSTTDLLGGSEGQDESSGGEDGDTTPQWNWREDERFNSMVGELLDLASGMQRTSQVFQAHREAIEKQVMETLQEYSGVINTLPGLVRLHEEAMEYYNFSKNKDSKTEAEEVRQNCETLNNILLAEFDYFSNHLVEDFEAMIQRFLAQQANYHRQMAEEWDTLHAKHTHHISSHHRSHSPIPHVISTSPTPPSTQTISASHPHLNTLHPPPSSKCTPSDALSSSGDSHVTSSHSQDDVGGSGSFTSDPPLNSAQSQSQPNIHSLGFITVSDSGSTSAGMNSRPVLTSNSDSHTNTVTSPAAADDLLAVTSPRSYVNFDMDEVRAVSAVSDRRLRSLSPLEMSIERELLEKSSLNYRGSVEGDQQREIPGGETGSRVTEEKTDVSAADIHPYANWQFEKMNEKSQRALSNPPTKLHLQNGGPQSSIATGKQERKPLHSPLRTPLKPPSPFKLQNLSDLTALESSSNPVVSPPSQVAKESSPLHTFGGGDIGEDCDIGASGGDSRENPLGKAQSTSKLQDISPTERGSKGLANTTSHSTRNINQLLPSQLNLGSKPRSYTTSHFPVKKKPVLPPVVGVKRVPLKPHAKMPPTIQMVGAILEREENLESSGELEHSFEKKHTPGPSPAQLTACSKSSSLGRDAARKAATGTRPTRQSSPSNELMRKLSLRRQKLEQQLSDKRTSGSTTGSSNTAGDSSSRCTSTSSTQSELVCSYMKRTQEDSSESSSLADVVELRSKEEANLAKYGIMEDIEGGSFVI